MEGRITAITRQKKNKHRFNIFIEGDYAFSISEKLAATLQIGSFMGELEIETLKKQDEKEVALSRAMYFLKFRPRSRYEIQCHLENKGHDHSVVAKVLERLAAYQYIDDKAFARMWIENRNRQRPRGEFALRYELKSKGISEKIIEHMLDDFDESIPAWQAIVPRLDAWGKLEEFDLRKKIYAHLKRRGFSFGTCEEMYLKALAHIQEQEGADG